MPVSLECATARAKLTRAVESAHKASVVEKAGALIKTSYLSSPKTLVKIIGSHVMFLGSEELPVRTVASTIDYLRAIIKHATTAPDVPVRQLREVPMPGMEAWKVGAEGFREGLRKAVTMMKTTVDPDRLNGDFSEHGVHFDNPMVERAVQQVAASHGAAYKPFWQFAFAKSVHYQALVQAWHEGLSGAEAMDRAKALYARPTDEMVLRATEDANYAAFQDRTALGTALSSFKSKLRDAGTSAKERANEPGLSASRRVGGQALYLASQEYLPFTQIPTSLAGKFIDYSPIGFVKTLVEQLPKENRDAGRLAFGLARPIVGTGALGAGGLGVFGLGYALAKAGKMTGSYPTDPKEQAEWQAEGKQENSLKVGGHWLNLQPIEPVAFMAIMGANVATAKQKNPLLGKAGEVEAAATSMGKTLSDQPYLMGVQQITNALSNPARFGPRLVSGMVPTPAILSQVAHGIDPTVRQANGIGQRLMSQVPGLSQRLPPRVDQFGRTETRAGGLAGQLLNPATASRDNGDPVTQELDRVQAFPGMPKRTVSIGKQKVGVTPQQYNAMLQQMGPVLHNALSNLIQSPEYAPLDDDQKRLALEKTMLAIRAAQIRQLKASVVQANPAKFGQFPNPYRP